MNRALNTAVFAVLIFFAMQQPAYAYIDPGSGSMVMTAILGLIAAVGYTIRKYYYKIRNLFSKKPPAESESE